MLADGLTNIGDTPIAPIVCRSGAAFPAAPLVGTLFVHATHGLCVYCHDAEWRVVARA